MEHYSCALHEVSNALTVVLGWLDLARTSDSLSEIKKAVEVAQEHARRGQVMARRSIGADVQSEHEHRTAASLIKFAATSVAPQAKEKGVTLEVEVGSSTEVRVEADNQVLQILTNLLLNAVAFSPPNHLVTLSVSRDDGGVRFCVRDRGPGMSLEMASRVFVTRNSTRPGGAGIGLPLSRRMARENGGELSLLDVDCGTCFQLTWPAAPSAAVPSAPPEHYHGVLDGKRVLVIEDDVSICTLVELSLEVHGGQVLAITDSKQLDEVLANRPVFDAVLLDLSPVKGRLLEILARLRHLAPDAPVILMSGEPTGVPEDAQGRFASWVRKPFDMGQLLSTLGRLLAAPTS